MENSAKIKDEYELLLNEEANKWKILINKHKISYEEEIIQLRSE